MVPENLSVRMEDSRFQEIKKFKKKDVPHHLHWFLAEDYFSEELFGFYNAEIEQFKTIAKETYSIFERATDKIIRDKQLGHLDIPSFFHKTIEDTWMDRTNHPLLYGRFDINGGLDSKQAKVIEFNADTCSTLPETVHWQPLQVRELKGMKDQFNNLSKDIGEVLSRIKSSVKYDEPFMLASSFGHKEDVLNCNVILDTAAKQGYKCYYTDLQNVTFSDEGIFYEIGGEFQPVDVWFKMIPWDWMFNEEPELAKTLVEIIDKKLAIVLNPTYTTIWQNKKFLAYITRNFPNNYTAETYLEQSAVFEYVEKPMYGRLGENVKMNVDGVLKSKGDYDFQQKIYQKYYPLASDKENYYYQTGLFFTYKPSALNLRTQNSKIITDDCEFMSHFII